MAPGIPRKKSIRPNDYDLQENYGGLMKLNFDEEKSIGVLTRPDPEHFLFSYSNFVKKGRIRRCQYDLSPL